jgi:small-conductance mechanosensitive channel
MVKILMHTILIHVLIFGFYLLPLTNAQTEPEEKTSEQPLKKEVSLPSQESVQAKIEDIEKRIKDIEEEINHLVEQENQQEEQQENQQEEQQKKQQEELLSALNDRMSKLKEIEALYEHQLQELKKLSELEKQKEIFDKEKALQIPSKPPYSISLYDQYLSELSEAIQQKQTAELALNLSEKLLKGREEDYKKAKSTVETLSEEDKKDTWTRDQSQIELEYRQAAFDYQLIKHNNNILTSELAKRKVNVIEEKLALISRDFSFDKNDLQKQLDSIQNRRRELTEKLEQFKKEQNKAEILWINNQRSLERIKDEQELAIANAVTAAYEQWYLTYQQLIEQYEGRLQLLNQQEDIWKKRFEIINNDLTYNELTDWLSEESLFRENADSTLNVVQSQHTNLQFKIAEIENRLSQEDIDPQMKSHLQSHLKALRKAAESNFYYLAALQTTKQLSLRLSDEINKQLNKIDIRKRIISLWNALVNAKIFESTVSDYFLGFITILIGIILVKLFRLILVRNIDKWSQKASPSINDLVIQPLKKIVSPLLYLGVLYLVVRIFTFHPIINKTVNAFAVIILTFYVIRFIITMTDYLVSESCKREAYGLREGSFQAILPTIRVTAWVLGAIFLLDNLGFNISTVIAGLGIGGIAIALAAQNILGDLFNYFVILFDRPFEIGDFIIVGEHMGAIEHVGIKTTRIRSLSGEQIVFSNTSLSGSQIRNYKRMFRRRVVFQFEVVYQTSLEKLKEIPEIVKIIITEIEDATFDRAHFFAYKTQSLVFEIVYYVIGNDYTNYMDIQQTINLKIKEEFIKREIHFAYATQILHLNDIHTLPETLKHEKFPIIKQEPR